MDVAMILESLVHLKAIFDVATEGAESDMNLLALVLVEHIADIIGRATTPPIADSTRNYEIIFHSYEFIGKDRAKIERMKILRQVRLSPKMSTETAIIHIHS